MSTSLIFRKQIALPQDHGSWVFLLSPMLIGLFAGGSFTFGSLALIIAALSAFLIRQPITTIIKIKSRRRSQRDMPAAIFWSALYGLIALTAVVGLVALGYSFVLWLAVPGVPVFVWHLALVSRRAERRQAGVEIVASGVLALVAPAAYWIGIERYDPIGWWLFVLTWFQSAASIVYAYLRLEQRELQAIPDLTSRLRMGWRALAYTSFNFLAVLSLSDNGILPVFLPIPYALQWVESIWGTLHPAIGVKPTRIGLRQLAVSILFTILFIFAWG